MGLANPWLLLGLAALAVPVLVHLVQRQEQHGTKFPSLMFVRRIPFEIKRRRRLRDRALLALRCLAVAAIAVAFASPYFDLKLASADGTASARDLVILLDRSYSMSHSARWKQAKAAAEGRIRALGPGERAALIAFQDRAEIVSPLSADKTMLLEALNRIEPGEGKTGYAPAFGAANRLLALSDADQRGVVIVSDLQRSALEGSGALPLSEDVALEIVPIRFPVGANATVTQATLAPQRDGSVEEALNVRVENTGDAPLLGATLELLVDGRLAETRQIELDSGAARSFTLPLVLAADRPTQVILNVGPDALPADDRYHLVLAPRRPIATALIEPRLPRAHHGVFIEEALLLARSPEFRVTRIRLDRIDETPLETFELVILDDVPVTPGAASDTLAAFVAAGGGVLAVAGPSLGAAWPGGSEGFLPGDIGAESSPAQATGHIRMSSRDHPLWAAPGLERGRALSAARVITSRRLQPKPGDRVLARMENGAPLLLERTDQVGRVLALTTTADPRWGTLALEPGFVPLVQAAGAYLAGRSGWTEAYLAGEGVDLARAAGHLSAASDWKRYLAGGGTVVVESPSGEAQRIQGKESVFFTPREAGLYQAHRAGRSGQSLPFAVNHTRTESILSAATPEELEARIVRRARFIGSAKTGAGGVRESDPFGPARWLLLLAALALMAESLISGRISRRRVFATKAAPT